MEELVYRVMPEPAAQVAAFESGELQILGIPPQNIQAFVDSKRYPIEKYLRLGVGLFLEFNVTKEPFRDIRVRRAFNHAIDKEKVLQVALQGFGIPAYGPLPPSIWGYWPGIESYAPRFDPAAARSLLAEAGWQPDSAGRLSRNGDPLRFVLYTAPIETWTRSAQVVQQQLKELGIQMEIQTFEFGTLLAKLKAGEQQAHFMGYTYASPDIVYLWFYSGNRGTGLNLSHVEDPKLDALILQSRREIDTARRVKI